jgi:hypothetical protein
MLCEEFCFHYGPSHKVNAQDRREVHMDTKVSRDMGIIKHKYIEAPILIT